MHFVKYSLRKEICGTAQFQALPFKWLCLAANFLADYRTTLQRFSSSFSKLKISIRKEESKAIFFFAS